jgi:hypothetical protein
MVEVSPFLLLVFQGLNFIFGTITYLTIAGQLPIVDTDAQSVISSQVDSCYVDIIQGLIW